MGVILETRDLTKVFGSLKANDGISIQINEGKIHGIVGENGSGKSTFLKMLFGLYRPTAGEIRVRGQSVSFYSPLDAIAMGLGMVQQHFSLVESLSAVDNIIMGAEPTHFGGRIDRARAIQEIEALLPSESLRVPWHTEVERLSVGYRQRIEIIKLLYRKSEVLFFDEPTAVLTPQEVDELFTILRKLKSEGRTIVLITHKLKEIFSLCDEVTVIRRGRVAGHAPIASTHPDQIVQWMMDGIHSETTPPPSLAKRPDRLMSVRGICEMSSERGRCRDVDLDMNAGEIVGIAGVEGAGQRSFFDCILGQKRFAGSLTITGETIKPKQVARVRRLGVGLIPEERLGEGLWGEESCSYNMIIGLERQFTRAGIFQKSKIQKCTRAWAHDFDVRAASLETPVRLLSGGNQQKVIFAREVTGRQPRLLLCYQPTRGVDLGASHLIHNELFQLRDKGVSTLVMSSDLDELLKISNRIYVFFDGRITAHFNRANFDLQQIGAAMTGANHE